VPAADPLRARLFGYGVPYRVRFGPAGEVLPVATDPARESSDLARELAALSGLGAEPATDHPDAWAVSMPFGRCGIGGLPREHLSVHHLLEGRLEVLRSGEWAEMALAEGRPVEIRPGTVVRMVARPRPGRRVLVAFQTQDRTPLLGNAGPLILEGPVPAGYAERLVAAHAEFTRLRDLAASAPPRCSEALDRFFAAMAGRLEGRPEVHRAQEEAAEQGSYAVTDEQPLFARQRLLLDAAVLARIRAGDGEFFRFPGMFGGVAPLASLVQ
jgi:hypothetical protein